jgi:hypothetical protein
MSKKVGDPIEIRLRELASKAASTKIVEEVDQIAQTTDTDQLWNNIFPEIFEVDYLRTLPRPDLIFHLGVHSLDLQQHVERHEKTNGKDSKLARDIQFLGVPSINEKILLLLMKKSRISLESFTLNSSPLIKIDTLTYLMSSFRNLTTFNLINSNINDMHLQTVYQRPRYLKDGVNNAVALENLNVSGNGGITDEGIATMIKADACRWLKYLNISNCPNISDMSLLSFKKPRMFRLLETLNVSNNNIGSLGVRQLCIACTSLISLNLKNTLIVDSTLKDIGNGLINLKELNIENCVLITDDGLINLFNYIPPVDDEMANINEDKDLGKHGWTGMSEYIKKRQVIEMNMTKKQKYKLDNKKRDNKGCTQLTSLSLRGCYNVRSRGLQALAYCAGGTMEKLNLKGLPGINSWTWESLSVAMINLKYLNVSGQLNKTTAIALNTAKELESHDDQRGKQSLARGDFYGHPLARMNSGELKSNNMNLASKNVETIIMTDGNLKSNVIQHLIQTNKNLLNIQLRGCKSVNDQVLLALSETCKSLEILLLGACELISDKGIISLCTGKWPVDEIKNKKFVPKTSQMLAYEAKKRKKKRKENIIIGCIKLKRLGLCGLWKLTDLSIQSLSIHCKLLKNIDIRENTNLTNKSIDYIQDNLLNLEILSMCNISSFDIDRLSRCARALPLVHGTPHVHGPHVILKYVNKNWLLIQKKRELHKRAVIIIQKGIKKYFASKRSLAFKIARADLIVLRRKKCATSIQSYIRGIAGRILAKERRKELRRIRKERRKAAATRIQSCIRRWIATIYVHKLKKAMQYLLKNNFNRFKNIVKKIVYMRKKKACSKIQNSYRSYIARTAYRRMIAYRNTQARQIQRIVRGVNGRIVADQYKIFRIRHALLMQRLVRGFFGRKRAVIVVEEIRQYRLWWDSFVISIQRKVKFKIRRKKWEFIISLANQKKIFLAYECQKFVRGMLGRIKAKKWISKWRYDRPTPLLFSTPKCAIFNYEFSHQMYGLQQHVRFFLKKIFFGR